MERALILLRFGVAILLIADLGMSVYIQQQEVEGYSGDSETKKEQQSDYKGPIITQIIWPSVLAIGDAIVGHKELVAAIATVFIAVYTIVLAVATRKLVVDNEESAKRQLRAYISVDTKDVLTPAGVADQTRVGIIICNCGQTPAHDLSIWMSIGVGAYPLNKEPPPPPKPHVKVKTVLHPGKDRMAAIACPILSEAVRNEVISGAKAIYLWGNITYKDVFGDDQVTSFVFFMCGEAVGMGRWAHYPEGNKAT